jgi:alanyl aminopeptidase
VVNDGRALVAANKLPVADMLARLPELARAPEPELLRAALSVPLSTRVPLELRPNEARFLDRALSARAKAYGWHSRPSDTPEERLLRPTLLLIAADRGENAALLAEAQRLANRWVDDPRAIEPDMVDAVLAAAATHGDRKLFERLRDEAKKTTDARRRGDILGALAAFRDPAIARDAYALALSNDFDIRESLSVLRYSSIYTEAAQWDFMKDNFEALLARLPNESRTTLTNVGGRFCDEARRDEYAAFFKDRAARITGGPRQAAQVLEGISLCIARRKAHEPSLTAFLRKY